MSEIDAHLVTIKQAKVSANEVLYYELLTNPEHPRNDEYRKMVRNDAAKQLGDLDKLEAFLIELIENWS